MIRMLFDSGSITKAVDVNKAYNVGTSYVALTPAIMVEDNGLKLSANYSNYVSEKDI